MVYKTLLVPCLLSLFAAMYFPLFFSISLQPFTPFLLLIIQRKPLLHSLWFAAFLGTFMDGLSSAHFGIHALTYTVSIACFFQVKRFFFIEKISGLLPAATLLSFFITLFQAFFSLIFGMHLHYAFPGILTDFFAMPLIDALYSLLWFYCPLYVYNHIEKMQIKKWIALLFKKYGTRNS